MCSSAPQITWNIVPSNSENAFTACSANIKVTKAKPLDFFVLKSIGTWSSAMGPTTMVYKLLED